MFHSYLAKHENHVPLAAIQTWATVAETCDDRTLQGIGRAVTGAWDAIRAHYSAPAQRDARLSLSMGSVALKGCYDFFQHYITKAESLETARERSRCFALSSLAACDRVAAVANRFFRNGQTVLVAGGHSPTLVRTLVHARRAGKLFYVVVPEARPLCRGYATAAALAAADVPVEVVADTAVAAVMSRVDLVVASADGVVESGGLIASVGTYQTALVAKALNKPFYALAESYRFVRVFPLSQLDVLEPREQQGTFVPVPVSVAMPANLSETERAAAEKAAALAASVAYNPASDYTPPELVTLLFTDLGILTPAAISDELISLHNA